MAIFTTESRPQIPSIRGIYIGKLGDKYAFKRNELLWYEHEKCKYKNTMFKNIPL